MTRQQKYYQRQKQKGLCRYCPRKITLYKHVCNVHALYKRLHKAKSRGHVIWRSKFPHGPMPRGEKLLSTPG